MKSLRRQIPAAGPRSPSGALHHEEGHRQRLSVDARRGQQTEFQVKQEAQAAG